MTIFTIESENNKGRGGRLRSPIRELIHDRPEHRGGDSGRQHRGVQNASLAFAPDGTLYMASANVVSFILVDLQLHTVDPATGQILTTVPTLDALGVPTFYTALTFRACDGVPVGGTGSGNSLVSGDIYTIDPATGAS